MEGPQVVGVVAFDPGFPGAFLFRARSAAHARALFEGIRPRARHSYFRRAVEGDDELAEELIRGGASRTVSLLHMVGAIPA